MDDRLRGRMSPSVPGIPAPLSELRRHQDNLLEQFLLLPLDALASIAHQTGHTRDRPVRLSTLRSFLLDERGNGNVPDPATP